MNSPRNLLDCWPEARRKLRGVKPVVIFLDFDGTLVRLRRRPEDVRLAARRRRLLRRLAGRPGVLLYFISGRRLADLRRLVRVPEAHYLGLHGWEQGAGHRARMPHQARSGEFKIQNPRSKIQTRLEQAKRLVERHIKILPGVWLQDKRVCFAVHYRAANAAAAKRARAAVREVLQWLGPEFRLLPGKKIWEILPRTIGTKGEAALSILARIGGHPIVFYFGDDTTDETAFAALKNAFTVRVGKFHKTAARYHLQGPTEVSEFLSKMDAVLEQESEVRNVQYEV